MGGSVIRELNQIGLSVPEEEFMFPGHRGCGGCGSIHAMRYALKTMGPKTIAVISASCWSGIAGALKVPYTHCGFATAGSWASGVRAGLDVIGDQETTVIAYAGDGGTFDIGLQSLSAAAERNEDFIFICNDNEAYMNTGIQRSSATPQWTWTTTTPLRGSKAQPKKDIDAIMLAHKIPYLATVTIAYPKDMIRKLERAKSIRGFRFIHVLAPCPTGWRFAPNFTVKLSRMSVETRLFPLFEVADGTNYQVQRPGRTAPVKDYLKEQGRFSLLTDEEVSFIQQTAEQKWEELLSKASKVTELNP